jgi:hypothetical protein
VLRVVTAVATGVAVRNITICEHDNCQSDKPEGENASPHNGGEKQRGKFFACENDAVHSVLLNSSASRLPSRRLMAHIALTD